MLRHALAVGLLAALGQADEAEIQARMKWAEARVALEEGDGKAALEWFDEAITGLPSDPLLLYEAACCAFDAGDLDRAEMWISVVVRTEDKAFKARPDYQDAFTIAVKVKAARRAEKKAQEYEKESAEYSKYIDVISEGIGVARSRKSISEFVDRTFLTSRIRKPLREDLAILGVFSGSAERPRFDCHFVIEGIPAEKTATAILQRMLGITQKEIPVWERLAAALERPGRIVESEDDEAFVDSPFHGTRKMRSKAYSLETDRTVVKDLEYSDGEIETTSSRDPVVAIALYEIARKGRPITYRVVVDVGARFSP